MKISPALLKATIYTIPVGLKGLTRSHAEKLLYGYNPFSKLWNTLPIERTQALICPNSLNKFVEKDLHETHLSCGPGYALQILRIYLSPPKDITKRNIILKLDYYNINAEKDNKNFFKKLQIRIICNNIIELSEYKSSKLCFEYILTARKYKWQLNLGLIIPALICPKYTLHIITSVCIYWLTFWIQQRMSLFSRKACQGSEIPLGGSVYTRYQDDYIYDKNILNGRVDATNTYLIDDKKSVECKARNFYNNYIISPPLELTMLSAFISASIFIYKSNFIAGACCASTFIISYFLNTTEDKIVTLVFNEESSAILIPSLKEKKKSKKPKEQNQYEL